MNNAEYKKLIIVIKPIVIATIINYNASKN